MEETIVSVIGKISAVWTSLHRKAGQVYGISPLQVHILDYIGKSSRSLSSITGISAEMDLSKPTISGAVTALEKKKLISRQVSVQDRRRHLLILTPDGSRMIIHLSSWKTVVKEKISEFSQQDKTRTLHFLIQLISRLHQAGLISRAKTCPSCESFAQNSDYEDEASHYCLLLGRSISYSELEIDCSEYIQKQGAFPSGG